MLRCNSIRTKDRRLKTPLQSGRGAPPPGAAILPHIFSLQSEKARSKVLRIHRYSTAGQLLRQAFAPLHPTPEQLQKARRRTRATGPLRYPLRIKTVIENFTYPHGIRRPELAGPARCIAVSLGVQRQVVPVPAFLPQNGAGFRYDTPTTRGSSTIGSHRVKHEPSPGVLRSTRSPFIRRASVRLIVRPSPVPPLRRVYPPSA